MKVPVKIFSARIGITGINPYVSIPPDVSRAFGKHRNIPIKGTLNGLPIKATLVPVKEASHRLYINGDMRKRAKIGVGDVIFLQIEPDTEPRILAIPEKLQEALGNNKEAQNAWGKLSPSHRNEILAYLNYLKTPEALERNVKKVINQLRGREKAPSIRPVLDEKSG